MSTCPYGASVKAGFNPAAYVPIDNSIFTLLSIAIPWWWNAFNFAFVPQEMQLSDLALLNPDDPPTPALSDILLCLDNKQFGPCVTLGQWIKAKLTYLLFTYYCVCNPSALPCLPGVVDSLNSPPGFLGQWAHTTDLLAGTATVTVSWTSAAATGWPNYGYTFAFQHDDGSGIINQTGGVFVTVANGTGGSITYTVPAGYDDGTFLSVFTPFSGARVMTVTGLTISVTCSSRTPTAPPGGTTYTQPPVLVVPVPPTGCTLDDVCAHLFAIEQKVNYVLSTDTLLQRWRLPFGYMPGTVHAGLTGSGSFPVSRLVGFLVNVTTPPAGGRVLPGNPPYIWDAGWMSVNDSNGMLEEKRITRSGDIWLPGPAALATSFNYALDPGVVLRVEELQVEA